MNATGTRDGATVESCPMKIKCFEGMRTCPTCRDGAPPPVRTQDWYENELELFRVEGMLTRAGVLRDDPKWRKDFREKPWKWSRERMICNVLEERMMLAGLSTRDWEDVTILDLAEALISVEESR